MTNVIIPNGVICIGNSAFSYLSFLSSVVIGSGVTYIEACAFNVCDNLSKIYYAGASETEWNAISISYSNDALSTATIYYYSETQPTALGHFWHYVDEVITEW